MSKASKSINASDKFMGFMKAMSLFWFGAIANGVGWYALIFIPILGLPWLVGWMEQEESQEVKTTPVEQVKSKYVEGDIGIIELERELERELEGELNA